MQTLVEFMNRDRLKKYKPNEKIVLELLDSDDAIDQVWQYASVGKTQARAIISFFKDKIECIGLSDFANYLDTKSTKELYEYIQKDKKTFTTQIKWVIRIPYIIQAIRSVIYDYLD